MVASRRKPVGELSVGTYLSRTVLVVVQTEAGDVDVDVVDPEAEVVACRASSFFRLSLECLVLIGVVCFFVVVVCFFVVVVSFFALDVFFLSKVFAVVFLVELFSVVFLVVVVNLDDTLEVLVCAIRVVDVCSLRLWSFCTSEEAWAWISAATVAVDAKVTEPNVSGGLCTT